MHYWKVEILSCEIIEKTSGIFCTALSISFCLYFLLLDHSFLILLLTFSSSNLISFKSVVSSTIW